MLCHLNDFAASNLNPAVSCVCSCSDKGASVSARGVDNDMREWISEVDHWNKATQINLVAS